MSSERSQIIDYTYQHVNSLLSGHREGTSPEQILKILESRLDKLKKLSEPFEKPSDASKSKIDGGCVQLADNVTIRVDDAEKEAVHAVSKRFQIDQVEALVLLRSFLYNEGLPATSDSEANSTLIEELLNAITPFYFSERLYVLRVFISLLRARESQADPFHDIASEILSKTLVKPSDFVSSLIDEYLRKTKLPVPDHVASNPRTASQWAKQIAKEQLGLVEVVFWTLWDYVPCKAPIVVRVFDAAYTTEFGHKQENDTLFLNEEGTQILRDIAALWIVVTIEVLNMENVLDEGLELSSNPSEHGHLCAAPEAIEQIHNLVMVHTHPGYVCTFLAWAFYVKAISLSVSRSKEQTHDEYTNILKEIGVRRDGVYTKAEDELHYAMVAASLKKETGLFEFLSTLLTSSPLFVTAYARRTGSTVTDPNAVAYRSVLKGLLISLVEYQAVEYIPDFDGLVEVWIALFGKSESVSVVSLCRQFWDYDWRQGSARRAIIDVARSRFPIQFRPLVRLLRAMTGAGLTDQTEDDMEHELGGIVADRQLCSSYVFHYLRTLSTYTQVLSPAARAGPNAIYDRIQERPGSSSSSSSSGGTAYINLRPLKLPGGSVLSARSIGRLLCSDNAAEPVVVAWQHEHSGWKILLEVLVDYIGRRQGSSRPHNRGDVAGRRSDQQLTLFLDDIGIETSQADEELVTDVLELVLSIIQDNPELTEALMESLEGGGAVVSHTAKDSPPPDLVQLIIMILEDSLARSQNKGMLAPPSLIAPALSVLSALLALPGYSNRVWLYLRSTSVLFGNGRSPNFNSAVLASERQTGQFPMTLSLLRLARRLFDEAIASLLPTQAEQPRLQAIKDEVLMRAVRFVHDEIWVEHSTWRYARFGDRFEIGRQVVGLFSRVLESMSTVTSASALSGVSGYVINILMSKATTSTINPIVHIVANGRSLMATLMGQRRFSEVRQLARFLESSIRLTRLILNAKSTSETSQLCLLEQILCTDVSIGNMSVNARIAKVNPIDVLAGYVKERELGSKIPLEAIRVLTALCASLSASSPSSPTIVGHLSDPQATIASLVRIVQHPYDDLSLRNAIWSFMSLAVDNEPTIAGLLVSGDFRVPSIKGKAKAIEGNTVGTKGDTATKHTSAVEAACQILSGWRELWEVNPRLLAYVMRFLDVAWNHGLEHRATLEDTRANKEFWNQLSCIAQEELGPLPDYTPLNHIELDDGIHSEFHDAVSIHAYRTVIKSHALHVIGADIAIQTSLDTKAKKPESYLSVEAIFKSSDLFTDCISESVSSSYDPDLHDKVVESIRSSFAPLSIDSLRSQEPIHDREFGDNFVFSIPLLRDMLRVGLESGGELGEKYEALQYHVYGVNLNLSLAHAQVALLKSWSFLLQQVKGYIRGDSVVRGIFLAVAASVSRDTSAEKRSGDMMCAVHNTRLSLLLALLEVIWFVPKETKSETADFMQLMQNLDGIVSSETFSPGKSFLGLVTTPFHRALLQIIYFCAKNCRKLVASGNPLQGNHRVIMGQTVTTSLLLVIDALRLTFDSASTRLDFELDKDMELLVAVFEQCTHSGLHASSSIWLTRCQETDVIRASLALLEKTDLVGISDAGSLRVRGQSLYGPRILLFHMTLAGIPFAAERLASEGVVGAYSNTTITHAASIGAIDATLPELPGERSPAHRAYCMMLSNVTGVTSALTSPHHFIESQLVGLVQLFGKQISRTLSWNNDEPLTLPFLDELDLTVELFYLMAEGSSKKGSPSASVLQVFTDHALYLLQHLNYALTHPKHLAGLIEPITAEERTQVEKETANVSVNTLSELLDPTKRPILIRVIRRLFDVTNKILSTLITLSGAEAVLVSDPEEWSLQHALIVPHSKVSVGEPASIGTLLELGNCAHDILRFLVHQKPAQTAAASVTTWTPEDVKAHTRAARQVLECVLMYSATQLVMWLIKHDGEHTGDMDLDDQAQEGHRVDVGALKDRDRRMKRKSLSLADRLRRGMTGEMTMDLQTLIIKSKQVITESARVLGPETIDLTQVLANFMEERVVAPP
ncbi:hypothetical protein BD410DRAFT_780570 [Rickenella mellea]|uniref:Nucleoporin NUP188 n=1 Tax=Rickenella mellea TaxID=50990 RepID=A0A4R5XHV7_9AGAM|nr:hypothetical protein BD410DRAFT_780570 [Rickenella mellea]